MFYYTALILVTVGALFNRSAFPYALVLCAVWGSFWCLERAGLYGLYPWVDCVSIYPLAFLTAHNPRWWNLTIVGLCFATVISHLVFWTAYYANVYLGDEYKIALRTLFFLSMAIALLGNTDVKRLVGSAIERVLGFLRFRHTLGFARRLYGSFRTKEALGDVVWLGFVRPVQHCEHGVGDRETDSPHREAEDGRTLGHRGHDVGADRILHLSETGS